jgi:hypothetical protein
MTAETSEDRDRDSDPPVREADVRDALDRVGEYADENGVAATSSTASRGRRRPTGGTTPRACAKRVGYSIRRYSGATPNENRRKMKTAQTTEYDPRYDCAQTLRGAKARYLSDDLSDYNLDAFERDVERVLEQGAYPDRTARDRATNSLLSGGERVTR